MSDGDCHDSQNLDGWNVRMVALLHTDLDSVEMMLALGAERSG